MESRNHWFSRLQGVRSQSWNHTRSPFVCRNIPMEIVHFHRVDSTDDRVRINFDSYDLTSWTPRTMGKTYQTATLEPLLKYKTHAWRIFYL